MCCKDIHVAKVGPILFCQPNVSPMCRNHTVRVGWHVIQVFGAASQVFMPHYRDFLPTEGLIPELLLLSVNHWEPHCQINPEVSQKHIIENVWSNSYKHFDILSLGLISHRLHTRGHSGYGLRQWEEALLLVTTPLIGWAHKQNDLCIPVSCHSKP